MEDTPTESPFNIGKDVDNFLFNGTNEGLEKVQDVIISATVTYYVDIYLDVMVGGFLALFGTISNIVSIVIFYRMGVNDSMSVCLMALSFSDFLASLISSGALLFDIWDLLLPNHYLSPLAIGYVTIGWWKDLFFLVSSWITTYLSIERCVCVVYPFKVKNIFTRFRAIMACIVIFLVNVAIYMPALVTMRLDWIKEEIRVNNRSVLKDKLVAKYSDNRGEIMSYMDIGNGALLPIPSQALVLVSVVWMIYGLNASSKVRTANVVLTDKKDDDSKQQSNLSVKERRLIKVVIFIAILLIICHIPRFCAIYATRILPAAYFTNPDEFLYSFLWTISVAFININASVNIFIYLIVNKKYRQSFNELFVSKVPKQLF